MLTVAKVGQGQAAGYAEYLEGRAVPSQLGDYYLTDGDRVEAPGRWAGGVKEFRLDPERPVSGDELKALMAVRRPDDGGPLRRVGASGEAVAAIDATFSAPKSVSAVWAVAERALRERIERAHEGAIDRALHHATEVVAMVRERLDQETVVHAKAKGVIATSWRHTTARAVEGRPPDPQLHSRVLLHGAIRHDEKVVAIDSRSWMIHRREVGAAYRTELACELAALGFAIQRGTGRGGRYFELEGVPRELLERWSSRHSQVREAIEARLRDRRERLEAILAAGGPAAREATERLRALAGANQVTPREDRLMVVSTRAAKERLATRADLDRNWAWTAKRLGFSQRKTDGLRTSSQQPEPASERELQARLTEFDPTFSEREARAVALEASAGVPIGDCLKRLQRLRSSGELLDLAGGRVTTRMHRAAERRIVALAARLAAADAPLISAELVEEHSVALERSLSAEGGSLSSEQREALWLACSDHQLVMIEGHAGSGKSTTLQAIARAQQEAGYQIIVTSTAGLAAERLADELRVARVEASAYSTVALDAALKAERMVLGPRVTVIHDEAALASTREQQRLLAAVEGSGARLIVVGDPRQSKAVGAGGLWPEIERALKEHGAHVELTRNVRALDERDREAQRLFREGEREQAIGSYVERERVSIEDEQRQAEDRALERAQAERDAGLRPLVIAQTSNEHLDELNARAQAIRAERGELSHDGIEVARRPYRLHVGDEVQIRHTLRHPEFGQLRNGTSGQVSEVDAGRELLTLRLTDGRMVQLERRQLDEADARLAYVQHPFLAQGQTTDAAHLVVSEHTTAEGSYVAITRARRETYIHASREQLGLEDSGEQLESLAERMGRSEPEVPSIRYPLAHEARIRAEQERELGSERLQERELEREHSGERDTALERTENEFESSSEADAPPVERVIAQPHLSAVRGQPPGTAERRAASSRAVGAIVRYRVRYAIGDLESVSPGEEPAAGYFERRYRRNEAVSEVLEALTELDPADERDRELQERALETLHLGRGSKARDRSGGWEP